MIENEYGLYEIKRLLDAVRRFDEKKMTGFKLPAALYKAQLARLKMYPFLKKSYESMLEIDGVRPGFYEQINKKIDVELKLQEMENAFEEIPGQYLDAVKFYLFSDRTKEEKRFLIETRYELDYKEVENWVVKLVYMYTVIDGWPVTTNGEEYSYEIHEDGTMTVLDF